MPKKLKGKKSKPNDSTEGLCLLCSQPEGDPNVLGEFYTHSNISAHYFCLLFASALVQQGGEDEGIEGFLPKDIIRESNRSTRLRCTFCKKTGATIGCVKAKCRVSFHFPCGLKNGVLNQYYENFMSYCEEHRPQQTMPSSDRLSFIGTAKSTCSICMCPVDARASITTLRIPCCKNSWFHRECIQNQATSAGMHFFKCPLCNNKEIFQKEMLEFGVYIPDRDALWETESNAYQELLERHSRCDVKCVCPYGRDHKVVKHKQWDIVLCDSCGASGAHLKCCGLSSAMDPYDCEECLVIIKAIEDNKKKSPKKRRKRGGRRSKEVCNPSEQNNNKSLDRISEQDTVKSSVENRRTSGNEATAESAQSTECTEQSSATEEEHFIDLTEDDITDTERSVSNVDTESRKRNTRKRKSCLNTQKDPCIDNPTSVKSPPRKKSSSKTESLIEGSRRNSARLKRRLSDLGEIRSQLSLDSIPKSLEKLYNCDIFTGKNLGDKLKMQYLGEKDNEGPKLRKRNRLSLASRQMPAVTHTRSSLNDRATKTAHNALLTNKSRRSISSAPVSESDALKSKDSAFSSTNMLKTVAASHVERGSDEDTQSEASLPDNIFERLTFGKYPLRSSSPMSEKDRQEFLDDHGNGQMKTRPSFSLKTSSLRVNIQSKSRRRMLYPSSIPGIEQPRTADPLELSEDLDGCFSSEAEKVKFVESFTKMLEESDTSDWEREDTVCLNNSAEWQVLNLESGFDNSLPIEVTSSTSAACQKEQPGTSRVSDATNAADYLPSPCFTNTEDETDLFSDSSEDIRGMIDDIVGSLHHAGVKTPYRTTNDDDGDVATGNNVPLSRRSRVVVDMNGDGIEAGSDRVVGQSGLDSDGTKEGEDNAKNPDPWDVIVLSDDDDDEGALDCRQESINIHVGESIDKEQSEETARSDMLERYDTINHNVCNGELNEVDNPAEIERNENCGEGQFSDGIETGTNIVRKEQDCTVGNDGDYNDDGDFVGAAHVIVIKPDRGVENSQIPLKDEETAGNSAPHKTSEILGISSTNFSSEVSVKTSVSPPVQKPTKYRQTTLNFFANGSSNSAVNSGRGDPSPSASSTNEQSKSYKYPTQSFYGKSSIPSQGADTYKKHRQFVARNTFSSFHSRQSTMTYDQLPSQPQGSNNNRVLMHFNNHGNDHWNNRSYMLENNPGNSFVSNHGNIHRNNHEISYGNLHSNNHGDNQRNYHSNNFRNNHGNNHWQPPLYRSCPPSGFSQNVPPFPPGVAVSYMDISNSYYQEAWNQ